MIEQRELFRNTIEFSELVLDSGRLDGNCRQQGDKLFQQGADSMKRYKTQRQFEREKLKRKQTFEQLGLFVFCAIIFSILIALSRLFSWILQDEVRAIASYIGFFVFSICVVLIWEWRKSRKRS